MRFEKPFGLDVLLVGERLELNFFHHDGDETGVF